ncbi:MAG TPA: peptidylprolyl isomerase [Gemmatimonadales bacterium]
MSLRNMTLRTSSRFRPVALGVVATLACAGGPTTAPQAFAVAFETTRGRFVIEVRRAWAPHGADRFFELVQAGYYDDSRFSRVIEGFIMQFGLAGDPAITQAWMNRNIPDDPMRESNRRGHVSYAMTGPDTRTTQVYVNLADNIRLDSAGFAPFGWVSEGMDVVGSLYAGYGEAAGGGMRAGNQGRVIAEGNAYLDAEFPLLDRLITATAVGGRRK